MSTTTTDNPISLTLRQTLGDYEVHITGDEREISAPIEPPNTSNSTSAAISIPCSWRKDYYRVPPYRPINRDLDLAERPVGSNSFEHLFLTVMFTGVSLNAGAAQAWGQTGGRVFTRVFKYSIGGEW